MFTDARIRTALENLMASIEPPPVPSATIRGKIASSTVAARPAPGHVRSAIAIACVIAMLLAAFPSVSKGIVQDLEARYRAALHALGGTAPPPAPESLIASLKSESATLATAQSRVPFTIVPPAGLPRDVVSTSLQITPSGVYSTVTHSYHIGTLVVTFNYRRANGRSFSLLADRFDPRVDLGSKYIFEADNPMPNGRPVLVKHRRFVWRNGDQVMSATDEGITASEIETIRIAMHGTRVALPDLGSPASGTLIKLYRINP
jgi:hypothetical protein